jgi:hypothetical protein
MQWAYTSSPLGVESFNDINAYWYRSAIVEGSASKLLRPPKA